MELTKEDFYYYFMKNSPSFKLLSMDEQGRTVEEAWKLYKNKEEKNGNQDR